jgi:hypothetical protein
MVSCNVRRAGSIEGFDVEEDITDAATSSRMFTASPLRSGAARGIERA